MDDITFWMNNLFVCKNGQVGTKMVLIHYFSYEDSARFLIKLLKKEKPDGLYNTQDNRRIQIITTNGELYCFLR